MKRVFYNILLVAMLAGAVEIPAVLHRCAITGSITLGECAMCAHEAPVQKKSCCEEDAAEDSGGMAIASSGGCCSNFAIASADVQWVPEKKSTSVSFSCNRLAACGVLYFATALTTQLPLSYHAPPPVAPEQSMLSVFRS